ncbi:MAG: ribonuclease H-like domain-containing protein, partial [Proteobacteria bacterium]|nr:ribonuclease H-like domain-containing protein [Pseudomonadota bacterium]
MRYRVLTLNNIATIGLERLPRERYEVASEIGHPDAIILRSADMHALDIPETVKAVARAGAGVNNIPVGKLTARGIPVFNAPGANANAVKELVVAGMLLAARNIDHAIVRGQALFFDTETTGLSGGTGTRAFMIGAADWSSGRLRVRQLWLTRLGG